ncbi:MAG: hypothetical protein DDT41_01730 [candidate division WS2 bacterium]|nr:hypothetical protein [Candidatus Psychracetigena formicireducens]
MRGEKSAVGDTLQGQRQPQTAWSLNRLFQSAMLVGSTPADVYSFWNRREIGATTAVAQQPSPVIFLPHKNPFPHIVSRATGGWGHVPQSDPNTIENRQRLEKLREGVKRKC